MSLENICARALSGFLWRVWLTSQTVIRISLAASMLPRLRRLSLSCRVRSSLHVSADLGHQVQPFLQQFPQKEGQVAFVAVALAFQALEQVAQHLRVVVCHVGRGGEETHQLRARVRHQVQLGTENQPVKAFPRVAISPKTLCRWILRLSQTGSFLESIE